MVVQIIPELTDTHCHLNFDIFNNDLGQVVDRARENRITRILIPGIDIETSKTALSLAKKIPEVYVAIGVHPNQGSSWNSGTILELRQLITQKKVVAIGEIGLDYYCERTPIALQRSIFLEQLGLAEKFGLPVIIHNRDASDDILNILHLWHRNLEKINPKLASYPGVLHSFSGDLNLANVMISHNFKLGIAGPVTFKKKSVIQSIVGAVPIESLLIETDAPYLTPHPYRGKRNEPANVRIVAEVIAEIIQQPVDKFANITTGEADKLFRWREIN